MKSLIFFPAMILCLPHSVTGEVYCFPRRQLVFSFNRRVIYHLKGLWEYIPKSIPSVRLYHDLQRKAGLRFYPKSLMLLYINGFVSTSSTNKWKSFFFEFWIRFCLFELITKKNIQTNGEAGMLTKVQCVMYQWIWLDKLYKLMESFFQYRNHFLN